jgi:hypothetical protein
MRTILLATLVAAGIGLLGASGASAAPVSGTSIRDAMQISDQVTQVGWHGPRRSHWRWGSRRWRRWWR